jgi:hypothetical protein
MIIAVYHGASRDSASPRGHLHFEKSPNVGEQVEINRTLHVVRGAWHVPSAQYAGPKFAILVSEHVENVFDQKAPLSEATV